MNSNPASALCLAAVTASVLSFQGKVFVPPPNWSPPSAHSVCHQAIENFSQSFIFLPIMTFSGS